MFKDMLGIYLVAMFWKECIQDMGKQTRWLKSLMEKSQDNTCDAHVC